MSKHKFGGLWTKTKLEILKEYLSFYVTALKETPYRLVYIDAFAGTGRCTIKVRGSEETIAGSAMIALDTNPPFERLHFIEAKPRHVKQLNQLLAMHPNGNRAEVVKGKAQLHLRQVLNEHDWASTRGVMFLDPYGLQCDWETIERIANTKALDVFFLVSLSGIYRQATNKLSDADQDKLEALSTFLGTSEWQQTLYVKQGGLFDDGERYRHADPLAVASFVKERLSTAFARVMDPVILHQVNERGTQGAPLYALFFAVSNPSKAAVQLASKVSRQIMAKLR